MNRLKNDCHRCGAEKGEQEHYKGCPERIRKVIIKIEAEIIVDEYENWDEERINKYYEMNEGKDRICKDICEQFQNLKIKYVGEKSD